jgi:hypothetical protein
MHFCSHSNAPNLPTTILLPLITVNIPKQTWVITRSKVRFLAVLKAGEVETCFA